MSKFSCVYVLLELPQAGEELLSILRTLWHIFRYRLNKENNE